MAARSPRRSFASPFVVTLAASLPVAGCYVQTRTPAPAPTHTRGDGPAPQEQAVLTHSNPPRPSQGEEQPSQPHTSMPTHATERPQGPPPVQASQPTQPRPAMPTHATERPQGQQPVQQTPAPAPVAKSDRTWTVMRSDGTCKAHVVVSCPKGKPGQPMPTCNPPPPVAYTCPTFMTTDGAIEVVQFAGSNACQVVNKAPPPKCPPGAMCNPPPPQKVTCPQ
ncbi:MAG: hypothetical protein JWP01_1590 [Myxococcales bacterium]|nr:hypothetical protein [Myxococcales bacterium]